MRLLTVSGNFRMPTLAMREDRPKQSTNGWFLSFGFRIRHRLERLDGSWQGFLEGAVPGVHFGAFAFLALPPMAATNWQRCSKVKFGSHMACFKARIRFRNRAQLVHHVGSLGNIAFPFRLFRPSTHGCDFLAALGALFLGSAFSQCYGV